ncbi:Endoglucanase E-4 precursor (plasmid) [Legionella adelaidensis]|uniref:Endoglucanase E-4 n=1 Tax=Legionella adelaidensis TaxID=45056 RepID=A0A0W0R2M4_9GAMM|nr:glycoside hydrolase family 9 protein [Legionella adelaidensis]KTC65304.1 Endoglucanase E-4 precursor [Legionella adelaidensis]VEH86046.1 Endoglucanase E-4 precursor [Legionella adelaidensis]
MLRSIWIFIFSLTTCLTYAANLCSDFQANYAEALQKSLFFFDAQRSGKLPLNYPVSWRADSSLSHAQCTYYPFDSGQKIDLAGGFYDSGDNVKFGLPAAFAITNLAWGVIEFKQGFQQSDQLNHVLSNLRWGTDYLLKAWDSENKRLFVQVGVMEEDHNHYFMPYEILDIAHESQSSICKAAYIDANYPGSDIAGPTAAALAASSIVFQQNGDIDYAQKLLNAAKEIYAFGKQYQGLYGNAIVSQFGEVDAYENEEIKYATLGLGVGAAWLAMAGEKSYLEDAKIFLPVKDVSTLEGWTYTWQDQHYSGYLLLAHLLPSKEAALYQQTITKFLNYWVQKVPVGKEGVLKHIDQQKGGDLSETISTALFALTYNKFFPQDKNVAIYQKFAFDQLNYILGDNGQCFSYMVGYGKNWPHYIHHDTAQGGWQSGDSLKNPSPDRHTDYGALVGGPDQNDIFANNRAQYEQSEPMITANSLLQAVLGGLNELNPGTSLVNFPPVETKSSDEFFTTGAINFQSSEAKKSQIEIEVNMFNHSAWPARVIYEQTAYFFLNLADKPKSTPINSTTVQIAVKDEKATDQTNIKVSPLQLWDNNKSIYYFTVTSLKPTFPGGENTITGFDNVPSLRQMEIKIKLGWNHNFSQDYSFTSLPQGSGHVSRDFKDAINTIPVYGKTTITGTSEKLWGIEPVVAH